MDKIISLLKSEEINVTFDGRTARLYWDGSCWKVITWKNRKAIERYSGDSLESACAIFEKLETGEMR